MRAWLVIPAALTATCIGLVASNGVAWAGGGYGQDTYATAQASGGQLTVQAGVTEWVPPTNTSWAKSAQSDPPPGKPDPNQPYGCTYKADPSAQQTLGAGGPTPGVWVIVTCSGPGPVDPMLPIWVSGAKPVVAAAQVSAVALAEQAAKTLALSSPAIEMAPPDGHSQLVNVATWLWVNPALWHPVSASATAGPVTATAVAAPTKVVWDMGDGQSVTCDGPGTPYVASDPNATTHCSYTWSTPGDYMVTATVYWSVSWTATGTVGGGNLGLQGGPAAEMPVTVTQSEAINTPSGGSD